MDFYYVLAISLNSLLSSDWPIAQYISLGQYPHRNLLPNMVLLFYFILFYFIFMKLLTYLFMYKFLNLFLFLFIIVLLLVRMRFHLNTLFEILKRIALWRAYYNVSCEIYLINGILIHKSTHTHKKGLKAPLCKENSSFQHSNSSSINWCKWPFLSLLKSKKSQHPSPKK